MKHLKKVLLLTFALAVIISIFMMTELPSSAATYSGKCGENANWSLHTSTGVLNITGTGDMYDYSGKFNNDVFRTTAPWNNYISSIKSVVIGNSVTNIGDYAFFDCNRLTSVIIPDSVTSIGDLTFAGCTVLTAVVIPDSVTVVGDYVFSGCESLVSVTIPDSVIGIGSSAFSGCKSLVSVTIPDSVISIGSSAFEYCTSLESVSIGNSVTTIGEEAFYNCNSITDLTFGDSLKIIYNSAFEFCSSLVSVVIPDSVEEIYPGAFKNCTSLSSVTLPDSAIVSSGVFNNTAYYNDNGNWENGVLYIDNHLIKAKTSVSELYTVKEGTKSIASGAFDRCFGLTGVTISDSVINISKDSFYDSEAEEKLDIIILCYENSYAYAYAIENHFKYLLMHKCIFTNYISDNNATCTTDGTKTAKCDRCDVTDTVKDTGSALGHSFTVYTSNGNTTCTADGTKTAKCDRCDVTDTVIETGTAYGHSFTSYESNNDATCTIDGTKTAVCTICIVADTVTDEGSAIGHSWSEWYVVTEPNYFDEGVEERVCSVCSEKETNTLPVKEYINPFTDVKESHWFYSAVEFVVKKGYMNGMSATTFSPNSNITREQFVLILANIAGVDTDEFKTVSSGFTDVPTGQWYSGAVTWAVKEGYVSGMSADKFGRGQSIQRAALARMLYNYASKNGIDVTGRADLSSFGDAKEFDKAGNAWMVEPVQWAVDAGIISGMEINGNLSVNPKGTATRAQAAVMLMKFDELLK